MKKLIALMGLGLLCGVISADGPDLSRLEPDIRVLRKISKERFYLPATHQYYDYLTSYEEGKTLSHLPSAEEVNAVNPDEFGYGTGMEDCMISAGVLLSMIVDQYAVTRDKKLAGEAYDIFRGIELSTTVHGVPGFLARGVCPEDGVSVYPATSRDQYTHVLHGLWHYYHSPLSSKAQKKQIIRLVCLMADRMMIMVTPGNKYDSGRIDGKSDSRGNNRMWGDLSGHEFARLPMIYAIAWDVSGNKMYYDLYRKYIGEAIVQSNTTNGRMASWTYPQMQSSLEVLYVLETEEKIRNEIKRLMGEVGVKALVLARQADLQAGDLDLTVLAPDWRLPKGGLSGPYRASWYVSRECGEMVLSIAMLPPGMTADPEIETLLCRMVLRIDPEKVSSCGIYHLMAGYWKLRRRALTVN